MNSCPKNRKPIALLALNELDAPHARELRAHLETCDACRHYLADLSRVTKALTEADLPDIRATEAFHQSLVRALKKEPSSRALALKWRIALPAFAICATALALLLSKPIVPQPASRDQAISAPQSTNFSASLANYRKAASRSPEDLDNLLARQAKRTHSPVPIYTASTLLAD